LSKHRGKLDTERASQLLERIVRVYEKNLWNESDGKTGASEGKTYLLSRGICDMGLLARHRVGFCDGQLKAILPNPGSGTVDFHKELTDLGIFFPVTEAHVQAGNAGSERFIDCVVFPVFDIAGNITTLWARSIKSNGNTGLEEFRLTEKPVGIWNASAMKTYSEIILMRSAMDGLSAMIAGHPNVIAIQGAEIPCDDDIVLMKRQGVRKITLLLCGVDDRENSHSRLQREMEMRCPEIAVEVKLLPDNHDANSFLVEYGAQALSDFLADTQHQDDSFKATADKRTTTGENFFRVTYDHRNYRIMALEKSARKLKATLRVENAGKLHVDTLDLYHARARRSIAFDLCRLFSEAHDTIEADLAKLIRHCESIPDAVLAETSVKHDGFSSVPHMMQAERSEAEEFGRSPDILDRVLADFEICGLIGEETNKLLGYIAMTSRKRESPLSVLILSSSGAGKTALQDAILAFCPPEDLVKLTSLSSKALFYKERLSLKNKVLALEEGDGAEEASYAIRNLISAGELVSESTIKDLTTGRMTTMENRVEGPTSVFLTTTNPEIDPETKSRFWVTSIDESREQTRRILLFQRNQHLRDEIDVTPKVDAILAKHRNFQRLLKPLAVKNPYAGKLTYRDDRLQGRRDQPKYLNLIKAIAFLRQLQKRHEQSSAFGGVVPWIEVDREEVKLANKLAHEILGHSLDELSRPGHDLLQQLEAMTADILKKHQDENGKPNPTSICFSRRDIREFSGWSNARVHRYLKELLDLEYVLLDSGRNGRVCRYRLVYRGEGRAGEKFVLGLKDLEEMQESK
jgi:hypothetical protein